MKKIGGLAIEEMSEALTEVGSAADRRSPGFRATRIKVLSGVDHKGVTRRGPSLAYGSSPTYCGGRNKVGDQRDGRRPARAVLPGLISLGRRLYAALMRGRPQARLEPLRPFAPCFDLPSEGGLHGGAPPNAVSDRKRRIMLDLVFLALGLRGLRPLRRLFPARRRRGV